MALNSLNLTHANSVLIELLKGKVLKTKLQSIVKNFYSLNTLVKEMEKDGLIDIELQPFGKNIQYVSLTPYGRAVAQKLKEAEDVSEGIIPIDGEDINVNPTPEVRENSKRLKFLFHFNVMDNHITLEEVEPGKSSHLFNIYIKQNSHGGFVLWCEEDDSTTCWHVKEAWGYPQVQKMMMRYKGKTKICPSCGYENPEEAVYCMKCATKLN